MPAAPQPAAPDVTVSLLSWNTRGYLRRCLASIYRPNDPEVLDAWERAEYLPLLGEEAVEVEVIVVDQASADGSAELVRQQFPRARLFALEENVGFAGGNNLALGEGRGRYFLLLNSDTVLRRGALTALVRFADAHPRAAFVGPKVLNPDGSLQLSCRQFPTFWAGLFRNTPLGRLFPKNRYAREYLMEDWEHDEPRPVDWLSGCCLLARREAVAEIGPLDEGFFMYLEDVDWALRARDAGWEVLYYPEPLVIHEIGKSTDRAQRRMILHHHRSAYRFFLKHYPTFRKPVGRTILLLGMAARCALTVTRSYLSDWKKRWRSGGGGSG